MDVAVWGFCFWGGWGNGWGNGGGGGGVRW